MSFIVSVDVLHKLMCCICWWCVSSVDVIHLLMWFIVQLMSVDVFHCANWWIALVDVCHLFMRVIYRCVSFIDVCRLFKCFIYWCISLVDVIHCAPYVSCFIASVDVIHLQDAETDCNRVQHRPAFRGTLRLPKTSSISSDPQHTATRCNTLQHAATQCNTDQL